MPSGEVGRAMWHVGWLTLGPGPSALPGEPIGAMWDGPWHVTARGYRFLKPSHTGLSTDHPCQEARSRFSDADQSPSLCHSFCWASWHLLQASPLRSLKFPFAKATPPHRPGRAPASRLPPPASRAPALLHSSFARTRALFTAVLCLCSQRPVPPIARRLPCILSRMASHLALVK